MVFISYEHKLTNSYWFKLELRSETLLDLEQRKYHIVIAQLDNTSFPDTVESILQERGGKYHYRTIVIR